MIKIENVNKYFNHHKSNEIHVIDNTSLEFDEKGLVAFLGASGSGKTTLLNIIGGLDKFNNGNIYINDIKINRYNYYKMDKIRNLNIGYIFQDYKLIDTLSVYDNIALVLKMIGIKNKDEIKKRVTYVLQETGMYRYRSRMANMLSGGERQRVGIARALVKNPNIILADEPTGNLDSKNSIEVMNIIKSISKNRLVILVTHEVDLAKFYADRIIEIQDGKVLKDYKNKHNNDLDYRMDNKIYLKDFEYHNKLSKDDVNIDIYSDTNKKTNISIVIKNGNIYIKNNGREKLEVVDSDSNIELINEHYKKINKKMVDNYSFDLDKIVDNNIKLKYSSIYNPITLLINGFKKIFNYSILKKILLIGFFITGIFILYSISSIFAILKVDETKFVTKNRNYLSVTASKIKVDDYLKYVNLDNVNYILPSDSIIGLKVMYQEYYQSKDIFDIMKGSLSSIKMINEDNLIYGKMPENDHEIVVDKMVLKTLLKYNNSIFVGINSIDKFVGLKVYTKLKEAFTIVGVTDLVSPSIYTYENVFINLIANSENDGFSPNTSEIIDYELIKNQIRVTKGRTPSNDYEVILNENYYDGNLLNKDIDTKVNERKLKVVGFYHSDDDYNYYLVNENTIKYNLVNNTSSLVISAKDKEEVLNKFREDKFNISNTYELDKEKYMNDIKDSVTSKLIVAGVIMAISLIEIFLMVRSSFLSRIKEIGVLRAIGVKKSDVIKMFLGEILAISTIAGLTGTFFMAYIIKLLLKIDYLKSSFVLDFKVILLSIILLYGFNILVGLFPVINVLRKTPASILSRHDIE